MKTKYVNVPLPTESHRALRVLALQRDLTAAELVRRAIAATYPELSTLSNATPAELSTTRSAPIATKGP
jgi:hypothetical protein